MAPGRPAELRGIGRIAPAFLVVALIGGGLWLLLGHQRPRRATREIASPYANAHPGVNYVGDTACAGCHAEIAASYRGHSMARALRPMADAPDEARGGPEERELFRAGGFQYTSRREGDRTIHREARRDGRGRVIGSVEGEARYVLGSGAHAMAFLIERDGYLFQSPITWYSQQDRWDLAPGYRGRDDRFDRQITPRCLVCHANAADHIEGTEGRYREPIFRGHGIGCERCHGPGELHAAAPIVAAGGPPNIVNPARLKPDLRDAVCQQCHLLGETIIARYGRALEDFRPGLPLHEFVTVFVRDDDASGDHPNADHVEQMQRSRCFRASEGAMGCVSCHDPHALPAPDWKVAYYRDRCVKCHQERGCSLPETERNAGDLGDNCVACHMPKAATSDVPHVATTLHSIPRKPAASAASAPGEERPPLVPFHRALMDEDSRRETGRDLGVALRHRRGRDGATALPLLETATRDRPDDILARESLGFVQWGLGKAEDARRTFDAVLRTEPNRESALEAAALVAGQLDRHDEAIALWRRAIAVDPWRSSFHVELAEQLGRADHWDEAVAAAREAIRLNPSHPRPRMVLILAAKRQGSALSAQIEFEKLLEFDPPDRAAIVRWFQSLR